MDVFLIGTTLAFVVYPFAVAKMPIATFWSIIFFIMIITLGVDSEVSFFMIPHHMYMLCICICMQISCAVVQIFIVGLYVFQCNAI